MCDHRMGTGASIVSLDSPVLLENGRRRADTRSAVPQVMKVKRSGSIAGQIVLKTRSLVMPRIQASTSFLFASKASTQRIPVETRKWSKLTPRRPPYTNDLDQRAALGRFNRFQMRSGGSYSPFEMSSSWLQPTTCAQASSISGTVSERFPHIPRDTLAAGQQLCG